jgi:ABC-type multidrug transport system ATPase subunit
MLFRLDEVSKTYGKITALRRLSVQAPEGAIGLLGPNGAGKTTLIRTLLGLITIDSGSGQVLGMDIRTRQLDIRQAVGFVPEDECLFPAVPGVEFVSYAGELCGMTSTDAMQRAHEHLLPDVELVCDHVLVLGRGQLLAAGKIQELKELHANSFEVRLKADPERYMRRLAEAGCPAELHEDLLHVRLPEGRTPALFWELAASLGEQIRYLRPQRSTLEEVFLHAVEERS